MATGRFLILLTFTLLVFICQLAEADEKECTAVTAAYSRKTSLYLVSGKRYTIFSHKKKKVVKSGRLVALYKNMPDVHIDAAWKPYKKPSWTVLVSGDMFYRAYKGKIIAGPLKLSKKFVKKTFKMGIDASATHRKQKLTYYFKGCVVVKMDHRKRRRHVSSIRRLGLPCDIDAAWYDPENERIIVHKSVFTWSVDTKRRKSYPFCFFCRS